MVCFVFLFNLHVNQAVIKKNMAAFMNVIIQAWVCYGNLFMRAFDGIIHGNTYFITDFKLDLAFFLYSRTNFGTFSIKHDTNHLACDLFSLMYKIDTTQMFFMVTM